MMIQLVKLWDDVMRNIRRTEKAITDENEMKQILQKAQYITLAMSKDNQPYLATLSHGYEWISNDHWDARPRCFILAMSWVSSRIVDSMNIRWYPLVFKLLLWISMSVALCCRQLIHVVACDYTQRRLWDARAHQLHLKPSIIGAALAERLLELENQ